MPNSQQPTEFQASSTEQGKAFEEAVAFLLKAANWQILNQRAIACDGYPTIDIVAESPEGTETWIECKGSYASGRYNGLERLTTIKVALGVAYDLQHLRLEREVDADQSIPYWIITSHFPTSPQGIEMIRRAIELGAVTEIRDISLRKWTP